MWIDNDEYKVSQNLSHKSECAKKATQQKRDKRNVNQMDNSM